jgi:hypothetical protein
VVSTVGYVANDSLALNLGGEKRFQSISELHFDRIARRIGAPIRFVLDIVKETVAAAQEQWPGMIRELDLPENIRERPYLHWGGLSGLLRIKQQSEVLRFLVGIIIVSQNIFVAYIRRQRARSH